MNDPTYLSLFSGIGGMDLGLERAGWNCVGQCEIDPYRRGILERWWPDVPRADDVRLAGGWLGRYVVPREVAPVDRGQAGNQPQPEYDEGASRVDLICGGFPCQDLSVAGKRKGLAGERSGLFFEFARIVGTVRPRWVLIENVPGLLSSHRGRDFAVVLATLADLGYGVAWRVLDSRYFGVPQRRRRVFVVGHLGADGPEPFLPFLEGGEGHPAEGGTAGTDVAGTLAGRSPSRLDDQTELVTAFAQNQRDEVRDLGVLAGALAAEPGMKQQTYVAHALTSEGHDASEDGTGRGTPLIAAPLARRGRNGESEWELGAEGTYNALRAGDGGSSRQPHALVDAAVRRLTPVECCRLQGFPDDWLGGNEPPDSPKYAALGDAVTVPVAQWIGTQIRRVA